MAVAVVGIREAATRLTVPNQKSQQASGGGKAIFDLAQAALREGRWEDFARTDTEFHCAVVRAGHNGLLTELYRGLTEVVTASIVLADLKTSKVLYRGAVHSLSSFNVVNDAFSAQVAQDDSDTRAVRDLADEIHTRIAIFLQEHAG